MTCTFISGCSQLRDCPKTPFRLSVPALPTCLPAPLSSVTWALSPPQHGTVELTSPNGHLRQSLPWQPCNDSVIIKVTEKNGAPVGHFCPQGAIQKVQIHVNVSVTMSDMGSNALRSSMKYVLQARIKEEISGNKQLLLNNID